MRRAFAVMLALMAANSDDARQKDELLRTIRDTGLDQDEVLIYWGLCSSGSCNELFAKGMMMQMLQEKGSEETAETKVFFSILHRITKHGVQERIGTEAQSFLISLLENIPLVLVENIKEKFKTI